MSAASGVWRFAAPFFKESASPGGAAAAVFLGVFIAHVPIYGFQAIVAVALAVALKLNKPITLAATFINNPLLQPLLIFLSVQLGSWVRHGHFVELSMAGLATMSPGEHLWTWVLGSLILGVILASLLAAAAYVALQALAWAGVHRSRRRAVEARYKSCPRAAQSFARWKLRLDRMFEILAGEDLRQGRVVDLGCGYGITLAWIAVEAPERELAGCDLSGERIHAARQALPAHRDSIGVADVRDFELGRAGLILIMDVLQYLEPAEQSALLTRCAAALEPGGGLIFRVHDWDAGIRSTLVMAFDRVILFLGGAGKRPANLPAVAYREMLAGTGLTIRERRFTNRLPLAHILFVATKPQESAG